ncbi:MAG: protein-methionine-sulfoxide reductase catalytic subunit MsrP [Gammaproteobacteria bacterium]
MIIKQNTLLPSGGISPSEITPRAFYQRRKVLRAMLAAPMALAASSAVLHTGNARAEAQTPTYDKPAKYTAEAGGFADITPHDKMTAYNNFYELGTGKQDPQANAHLYKPRPWQVSIEGEVAQERVMDIDDLLKLAPMEERVYRLRCVEAWSMVVPWMGYSLSHIIKAAKPTGNAKYVQFVTFNPVELFPDRANSSLPWPYLEGLRMDEAMHPLTMMVFGVYGELLPTQCGAPLRLMVPWKYGFKSGKALVALRFTEEQPETTWNAAQSREYGFYANVNPEVSHPRWSQSSERAITDSFLPTRRKTDPFNGYADQVASLYAGMDLKENF